MTAFPHPYFLVDLVIFADDGMRRRFDSRLNETKKLFAAFLSVPGTLLLSGPGERSNSVCDRGESGMRIPSLNHFLACLSAQDRFLIVPHLTSVPLTVGQMLQVAGEPSRDIYFPRSGIVSLLISFSDGRTAEAGLAGFNTVVAAAAALGDEVALSSATVQIAGAGDKIETAQLKRCAGDSETLRDSLRKHVQALSAQTLQIAGCNAVHSVEERLCRWLLQCRDLLQSNALPLTHEFLAAMLGVRRTSVTLIAGELQKAGLINCRRGCVELLDLEKISDSSCECYEVIGQQLQRIIGWAPQADQRRCS